MLCSVIDPLLLQASNSSCQTTGGVKQMLLSAALLYHVDVHDAPKRHCLFCSCLFAYT